MVSVITSRWSKVAVTAVVWLDEKRVLLGEGQFVILVSAVSGSELDRCQVLRAASVHSLQNTDYSTDNT